jgi:ABC-type amino acid transport system permease subunit
MLVIVAVGAALVSAFALFLDNAQTKLPLLVASLAVFGIAVGALGFALASSSVSYGEAGRMGRALVVAFVAGLFVLVAAGSIGMAIVLGILAGGIG